MWLPRIFSWCHAVRGDVPPLQAVVAVNRNKPVECQAQLIVQPIEAHWALVLKSPILRFTPDSMRNMFVDMVENVEISVIGMGKLCTKIRSVRNLSGNEFIITSNISAALHGVDDTMLCTVPEY
jgi:hypothetical protein